MKNMVRGCAAALLLCLVLVGCTAGKATGVVGIWRSPPVQDGERGCEYELAIYEDNSFDLTMVLVAPADDGSPVTAGSMERGIWTVEDNAVFLNFLQNEQTQEYRLEDGRLVGISSDAVAVYTKMS